MIIPFKVTTMWVFYFFSLSFGFHYIFWFTPMKLVVMVKKKNSNKQLWNHYFYILQVECEDIGRLSKIRIGHDNSGMGSAWFLEKVMFPHHLKEQLTVL